MSPLLITARGITDATSKYTGKRNKKRANVMIENKRIIIEFAGHLAVDILTGLTVVFLVRMEDFVFIALVFLVFCLIGCVSTQIIYVRYFLRKAAALAKVGIDYYPGRYYETVSTVDLIRKTRKRTSFMLIAGPPDLREDIRKGLVDEENLSKILTYMKDSGKEFHLLFLDPYSDPFNKRMTEEKRSEDDRKETIDQMTDVMKKLLAVKQNNDKVVLKVHNEHVFINMTIQDNDKVYIGHYERHYSGHQTGRYLFERIGAGPSIVSGFMSYFNDIWENKASELKTEANVESLAHKAG